MLFRAALLGLAAIALAAPSSAQVTERNEVERFPGVAFGGLGGVELVESEQGYPVAKFWRPMQFGPRDNPLGGRMDCRAAARPDQFSAVLFDVEQVASADRERIEREGWSEMDRSRTYSEKLHRLDIVGRRTDPRRYVVLTYIAARAGDGLVSIRRNCTMIREPGAVRPDYLELVDRYTGFTLDLPEPAHADPLDSPSLESLVDINA